MTTGEKPTEEKKEEAVATKEKPRKAKKTEGKAKKAPATGTVKERRGDKIPMRTAFREIIKHAHDKRKGNVGTREELVEKLSKAYPKLSKASLGAYIGWAKAGVLPGCYVLAEKDGVLRTTAKFIHPKREE